MRFINFNVDRNGPAAHFQIKARNKMPGIGEKE